MYWSSGQLTYLKRCRFLDRDERSDVIICVYMKYMKYDSLNNSDLYTCNYVDFLPIVRNEKLLSNMMLMNIEPCFTAMMNSNVPVHVTTMCDIYPNIIIGVDEQIIIIILYRSFRLVHECSSRYRANQYRIALIHLMIDNRRRGMC